MRKYIREVTLSFSILRRKTFFPNSIAVSHLQQCFFDRLSIFTLPISDFGNKFHEKYSWNYGQFTKKKVLFFREIHFTNFFLSIFLFNTISNWGNRILCWHMTLTVIDLKKCVLDHKNLSINFETSQMGKQRKKYYN